MEQISRNFGNPDVLFGEGFTDMLVKDEDSAYKVMQSVQVIRWQLHADHQILVKNR
jgi:hypothetical protein